MNLNFIKDKEIDLEQGDLLATRPYATTLEDIIDKAETPFTIGLFGGWGTGKSSIIHTLQCKLNADKSSNTHVFVYDAWKYSTDPFRRTFISKLKEEFRIKGTLELESFYSDKNKEVKGEVGLSDKWWLYIGLFIAPLIFINAIPTWQGKEFEWSTFVISIFISALTVFISKTFVHYKISISKPRTFAPEQFEGIFKEFIGQVVGKQGVWKYIKEVAGLEKKITKVVIVIDNIDRCHKDLAFELLLTVKNFLEQKDVVFVIPIDEGELKKHLAKQGHDGNEFLRKLFNTTLTIRKFSESDFFKFTKELQETYKLGLSDDVLSLISQEFSRNPRKIIQFLNVLQSEIKLAEEQEKESGEKSSNFKKGTITNNVAFLVKVLLIREEWSDVYDVIQNNPFVLEDINDQIDRWNEKIVIKTDINGSEDFILTNEQRRFFESTRDITAESIESFFSNKDAFPGVPDDMQKLVLAQDWETIKSKYLEKGVLGFNSFTDFVDKVFYKEVVQKGLFKRSGLNIISLVLKIAEDETYGDLLKDSYYSNSKSLSQIRSKINNKEISGLILNLNPVLMLKFAKQNLSENERLLGEVVNQINTGDVNDKKNRSLLLEFTKAFSDDETHLKKIGERFSKNLRENPELFSDFEDVLKSTVAVKSLIKEDLLREFISELGTNPDEGGVRIRVEIINQYNLTEGLSMELREQYVSKIVTFLSNNNLTVIAFWTEHLELLVEQIETKSLQDSVFTVLKQKNDFLWQQYASQWNQESYKTAVTNFLAAATSFYNSTKASRSEMVAWLNNYFARGESTEYAMVINGHYKEIIKYFQVFEWSFADQVITKFKQLTDWGDKKEVAITLNLMLSKTTIDKGLSKIQIQNCLNNYIDGIATNEEDVKKWLSGVIKNDVIKTELATAISGLDINRKLDLIDVIKELDKELLQQSVEEVVSEAETDQLENTFMKLDNSKAGLSLINSAIEKKVRDIQKEGDDDFFVKFLTFIVERKLAQSTLTILVNKVSPFLHDGVSKQEKIFALDILSKIDVPKDKQGLVKELLKNLDHSDFGEEDNSLLESVKKAIK